MYSYIFQKKTLIVPRDIYKIHPTRNYTEFENSLPL